MTVHHLIVGGQRSGKSRHAETLAEAWLRGGSARSVTVVATAIVADDEMRARVDRHRADRPRAFDTAEVPRHLAASLQSLAEPGRLLLVDCLTLWLTNWLMPAVGPRDTAGFANERTALLDALPALESPVLFVSNEVGWGVVPMAREVRHFVDELGRLNQDVARHCSKLTLMVAGQPWTRDVADPEAPA